ncbi:MAG: helix-turn-helix transcriptional regulator [Bryobacterales bacterium]|nr:helix-turn-helix transcriptional regulator [Bryobacterales bacterium]
MDVSLIIRQRLKEMGLDQRQLAAAVQVTDSYVSQLLTRKKPPPAPGRTDLYEKISQFLDLPAGQLEELAVEQRKEDLKRRVLDVPNPLFKGFRELILRKCDPEIRKEVRRIVEKDAFGELERLVTQKILDVTQGLAREELRSETWLQSLAQIRGWSYEQMRVAVLDFLDTDVAGVSTEHCAAFLDPMILAWDIDLRTFALEITLNPRVAPGGTRRFEFMEKLPAPLPEPGLDQFLADEFLRSGATPEEIGFLKRLSFGGRRPAPLYYYRELQNLRDPLHFPELRQA